MSKINSYSYGFFILSLSKTMTCKSHSQLHIFDNTLTRVSWLALAKFLLLKLFDAVNSLTCFSIECSEALTAYP